MKRYGLAKTARKIHIPQNQIEIIIGCLLGSGSLTLQTNNFHRLSFSHCKKQLDYLLLKKSIIDIFMQENVNEYINKKHIQYHLHSISHKDLTNIYGLFYRNKKRFIQRRFLNLLTPTSLLFWFGDNGSIIKSSGNTIIFCTDTFTLSENRSIKKWLWQEYDIDSKIMESKGSYKPDKTYYRLRLTKEPTKRFFNLISSSPFFLDVVNVLPWKFPSEYLIF